MGQSKKDGIYLKMACEMAEFSKCVSIHVACLLVRNDRILSTGVNGTPSGWLNCSQFFDQNSSEHKAWSAVHEIHAELNAVIWAARMGISIDKATAYVTHAPCSQCTKNMIAAGIQRIVYKNKYYRNENQHELVQFAKENGVSIDNYDQLESL
ncbi:MAG: dCMP deaminase [Endozoicomonadaceae bacterium]|nr:dCMP deaminase [Endozoicomonadaceae bacterium]MBE8232288.1 dCMP deaminase [Endozoicomonadaceae bacterium]